MNLRTIVSCKKATCMLFVLIKSVCFGCGCGELLWVEVAELGMRVQ